MYGWQVLASARFLTRAGNLCAERDGIVHIKKGGCDALKTIAFPKITYGVFNIKLIDLSKELPILRNRRHPIIVNSISITTTMVAVQINPTKLN